MTWDRIRCASGKTYWRVLTYLSIIIPIIIGASEVYNSRQAIAAIAPVRKDELRPRETAISSKTRDGIEQIFKAQKIVAGVAIFTVDLHRNVRRLHYVRVGENVVEEPVEYPYFLTDNDAVNSMAVSLLNGSFMCYPIGMSPVHRSHPDIFPENVVAACSLGIPPAYGKFLGILTVYTIIVPDKVDIDMVRLSMRSLSYGIYDRGMK